HGSNQMADTFGVQIAAEHLKLRGEQHCVSLIDLLRGVAPPWAGASDGAVCILDLIQRGDTPGRPVVDGGGRHGCILRSLLSTLSSKKSLLRVSWPGIGLMTTITVPAASASEVVKPPGLDTTRSAARIHSSISVVKPMIWALC